MNSVSDSDQPMVDSASAREVRSDAKLARHLHEFAAVYRGASPLYERLANGASRDAEILALATHTQPEQPAAHLLMAAVHLLLLRGERHPLARFYPTVAGTASPDREDPYPAFRAFCLEHAAAISRIVSEGLVQTNEPRRCSVLLPAVHLLARRAGNRPVALIEIGASAGLNLLLDRYGYKYGDGTLCGDPTSPVQITCELRGDRRPPLPSGSNPVHLASRIGIDVAPVDVRNPEQAQWLRALVWPDEAGRAELLDKALDLARTDPPRVLAGDAVERLPEALAGVAPGVLVCLVDFFTLQQLEPYARARLTDVLAHWTRESKQEVFRLAIEGGPSNGSPQLRLASAAEGLETEAGHVLAHCDRHGAWLEWVDVNSGSPPPS